MTRKLHNTLMAVIASSSLLVVGIIASSPIGVENATSTTSEFAVLQMQVEHTPYVFDRQEVAPIQQRRAARHRRQSLAMPFFSFAPRS